MENGNWQIYFKRTYRIKKVGNKNKTMKREINKLIDR